MYRVDLAGCNPVPYPHEGGNGEECFDSVGAGDQGCRTCRAEMGDKLEEAPAEIQAEKKIDPLDGDAQRLHETVTHGVTFAFGAVPLSCRRVSRQVTARYMVDIATYYVIYQC